MTQTKQCSPGQDTKDKANRSARPVYLDNQATTPTDPRVVEAMLPFFNERFGNAHSAAHAYGWDAEDAVERARADLAALIGASPREIVFTSGATEANNLAIKGAARFHRAARPHVVTYATEHKCVLESCRQLEREGFRVTILPVQPDGLIDLDLLADTVSDETAVVSVMAVNNEIGVIQPLAEIAAICREKGAYFHSDAAQAVGKIPVNVVDSGIDLLSISGHKFYAPMGIGALYVRRRPRVRLEAMIDGGGQERGLRSGTLATPLCVGLGMAARLAAEEMPEETARISGLKTRLLEGIRSRLDGVLLNADAEARVAGNLNLAFEGVDAEALMKAMPRLALSSGSACTSTSVEPSYVLRALGMPEARARASLRVGIGRFTSEADIDLAIEEFAAKVASLRAEGSQAAE
ncbi:aminotransferase class V-fold PLP-dependent enzyme [Pelagibius litoralis]|uniref:Cysteine desulfurase n=1 Tax=Pelagibius litoralis TaxID=374515 RepID=A0A967C920_9PROT|nr:aminotransferase class V-fold PLP-dependent enzyme [Pelagibius litoralis]NIA68797.1 aminotransferase class V-fold PLP-dependent enzyme [Pelagibius litoralis]